MKLIIALFAASVSGFSFAWGPKGQEITVKVAEMYLSPKAQATVARLLEGRQLSSFATWADQARSFPEWKYTAVWHYVNVNDQGEYDHGTNQTADDVVKAMVFCVSKLSSNISDTEKATWLKFLIHMVGDLHQPLHVGRSEDRGGNSTQVRYGRDINLHALWDSAFIEKQGLTVEIYVKRLKSQNRSIEELGKKFNADAVIKENFIMRPFVYSFKNDTIDSEYEKKAILITDDRLWVGGIRLASLLNSILN